MAVPSRSRSGFTLVELLIVIVILGILGSLAIVKSDVPKTRAAVATMQSDLRNMAVAQEAYFLEFSTFTDDISDLDFLASPRTSFTINANDDGWTARSTHQIAPNEQCAIAMGDIAPLAPASDPGIIRCAGNGGGGGNPGCNGN